VPVSTELPVSAEQLREKVDEVLARPEFTDASNEPSSQAVGILDWLLEQLTGVLRWIYDLTQGLPEVLRWLIVAGLTLLLVILIVHILWTFQRALTGAHLRLPDARLALEGEPKLHPDKLEADADEAAANGDLIGAIRLLLRASLLRLELREKRPFRRGMTNRQHLARVRRTPFFDPLQVLVRTIELKWYGDEVCEASDYDACRQAHGSLRSLIAGGPHADAS
jgi:hypothetical protein